MPTRKIATRKTAPTKTLTDQQQRFVDLYISSESFNATQAAKDAGFKGRNAGSKLLANKAVAQAIGHAMSQRKQRLQLESDDVLREITAIAFFNIADYLDDNNNWKPMHELTVLQQKCIRDVRMVWNEETQSNRIIGYNFYDKMYCLELCMKHLGMLDERFKVEHDVGDNYEKLLSNILTRAQQDSTVIDGEVISSMVKDE